jgi:hypothetical protein
MAAKKKSGGRKYGKSASKRVEERDAPAQEGHA